MIDQHILVIGEIFIDTHLDILHKQTPLVRLGGIFHAARAFYACDSKYSIAYYAPLYLERDVETFAFELGAQHSFKLGNIDHSPNVLLISDSTESGFQGYCNIVKDQAVYYPPENIEEIISIVQPTDVLLFPGRFDNLLILNALKNDQRRLHIDLHYDCESLLDTFSGCIDTIFTSTSSSLFQNHCHGTLAGIKMHFKDQDIIRFVVKENRGGSYMYNVAADELIEAPSYVVNTMHSVGVGDVFDSVFLVNELMHGAQKALRYAALVAAWYAETMDVNIFRANVLYTNHHIDEEFTLMGIRLPWDIRSEKNIYIAAPDFPDVNTVKIDHLVNCLQYHNFKTRRPVQENGLATPDMSVKDEQAMYRKDIDLLYECDILIAVLLYNDPGMLVELGMFKQMMKPTILYDPYSICDNLFVKQTPDYMCKTVEEVISSVFQCLGKVQ